MRYIRIMCTVLLLCLGMGAWADNKVTLSTGTATPGQEVTIEVSLTNSDAVSALQLSIPLDENLTYVANSIQGTTRLNSHTVSAGVKDGVLNIMIYSETMANISGNSGAIASFRLLLGDMPGNFALTPSKLMLTDGQKNPLAGSQENGSVTVSTARAQYGSQIITFGRVPIKGSIGRSLNIKNIGNEKLTISKVTFADTEFSTTATFPIEVAAGGSTYLQIDCKPTKRGNLDSKMEVTCNGSSKQNTILLKAEPFAVNELHIDDVAGTSDDEVTINLRMNNQDPIVGFHLEFQMPEALKYVDGSFVLSDRKDDHEAVVTLQNGLLRIVGYSASGKAFKSEEGLLASFKVTLSGRQGVSLRTSKAILTASLDGEPTNVLSASYSGYVNIVSPKLNANSTLDFGECSMTEAIEKTFSISNYGNADLVISKVLFDNEHLSIKEQLPLTISQWNSKTITVQNTDKTEGDFSSLMQIYSNDPELRMFSVQVTGKTVAPNYMTFSVDEVATLNNVRLTISTDNYDAIGGFQFDVVSDDSYTLDNLNVEATSRATGISMTGGQIDKRTLRVFGVLVGGTIAKGNGKVVTIGLLPSRRLTPGSANLTISNMKMSSSTMVERYVGPAQQTVSFTVIDSETLLPGDINRDGTVDSQDINLLVDYIMYKKLNGLELDRLDVNKDTKVNAADIVVVTSYMKKQAK